MSHEAGEPDFATPAPHVALRRVRSTLLVASYKMVRAMGREDDYLLGQIFYSLNEDCQWHRQWTESLVRTMLEDDQRNANTIQRYINSWYPSATRAVNAISSCLETLAVGKKALPIASSLEHSYRSYLQTMNLTAG